MDDGEERDVLGVSFARGRKGRRRDADRSAVRRRRRQDALSCRLDLNHTGWKQYEVPLRWCRWSTGRIPQWQNVVRIGFWCREAGDFWIDDVAVVEAGPARRS
ncbi:MAG: hypothetical protein QM775_29000 [Pirellulales bacterium]